MALTSFSRCPSGRPSSLRCSSLSVGKTSPPIALSRNVCSYCSRPRLLSQAAISTTFLPIAEAVAAELGSILQVRGERCSATSLIDRVFGTGLGCRLLAPPGLFSPSDDDGQLLVGEPHDYS